MDLVAPTPVVSGAGLPYPVTVDELIPQVGDRVSRGDRLFAYKFWYVVELAGVDAAAEGDSDGTGTTAKKSVRESVEFFESPFEGTVVSWDVDAGDEIPGPGAPLCLLRRPCNHDVVYNGLCTLCGREVDEYEIQAAAAASGGVGPNLTVSHRDTNLQISRVEAQQLDLQLQQRLRAAQKLVLVVDLDQTVVHCGVDPTIGEWKRDPRNPNYEALRDVQSFALEEEPILPFLYVGGKRPAPRKCWYYVKVRPGLKQFFKRLAPLFEMHIYTMATRAYALEIAKIIDPDKSLFGDRILSRDENGSLTHKSLERLFPTDQSMVTVIDDRGDVWNWCANLIKVVPYNFFVGVGDINSNFLPKQQPTMLQMGRRSKLNERGHESKQQQDDVKDDLLLTDIMNTEKQLQEKIDQEVKRQEHKLNKGNAAGDEQQTPGQSKEEWTKKLEFSASVEVQQKNRPLATLQKHLHNQKLLVDNDDELFYLKDRLADLHKRYYSTLKENPQDTNIQSIMTQLKTRVFQDCHFVFSGLIPLNTNVQAADIVIWTNKFGATTTNDLDETTTHLITKTPGTNKARLAKAFNPDIKIVHPDWIFECLIKWERVDVKPYLLIVEDPVSEAQVREFKEKLTRQKERAERQTSRTALLPANKPAEPDIDLFAGGISWLNDEDDEEIPKEDEESEDDEDENDENNTTMLDDGEPETGGTPDKRSLFENPDQPAEKKPRIQDAEPSSESDSELEDELLNVLDD
ncbi:protein serine/threonine phosphatase KNAG_0J00280 [Huiozyma naganishii CBS 8797]|uniref:RNA polymerase II subunit A C-terminal domain phosphatase n=1 Tax=Huiozyma naganishii (strain ATCC MYA-139 / BCRC 22969 / CBS 8797 / KCTC 17520 / NBRC 10181 / NCYC 3082 / Yp74L-3) TaxID=1071383 RepID=J7SAF2_HUIN7|nr:hypothetical protein KNAG_0J00280 [Kazachstania naganishii CBS 8797]CCK72111.1 hypothetical protein KNAG_0J00280 [Kazachstania naganishii CBS 8797]